MYCRSLLWTGWLNDAKSTENLRGYTTIKITSWLEICVWTWSPSTYLQYLLRATLSGTVALGHPVFPPQLISKSRFLCTKASKVKRRKLYLFRFCSLAISVTIFRLARVAVCTYSYILLHWMKLAPLSIWRYFKS